MDDKRCWINVPYSLALSFQIFATPSRCKVRWYEIFRVKNHLRFIAHHLSWSTTGTPSLTCRCNDWTLMHAYSTYSIDQRCSQVACAKLPSIDHSVQQPGEMKAGEMALDLSLLSTWTSMSSPRGSKRGHIMTLVCSALKWPPAFLALGLRMPAPLRSHPEGGPVTRGEFSIR